MVQSKKQLENDFVYWMDKSQEYDNSIRKLSALTQEVKTDSKSPSQIKPAGIIIEKKRLQKLKADADACAKEIQQKISTFYKLQ
jgi:hypothetical protein